MFLVSNSFANDGVIPSEYAFCEANAQGNVRMAPNRNPHLEWGELPSGTQSLVLICVDPDAPSKPDDVNQEGRQVPADLPRVDFHHWVMVDIPVDVTGLQAGMCSDQVVEKGKQMPWGPEGSRQGINDYTQWFAGDDAMEGQYFGYDGPCPPWNDSIPHRYYFRLYAVDFARCPVEGAFTAQDVLQAIEGHVLGEAVHMGRYSLNPAVSPAEGA